MNRVVMLAFGSILVGIVVLTLKSLAYFMTGSVALLSDAIESIVNVATAVAAFIAIRLSAKPHCQLGARRRAKASMAA
jgi:divalent metal cation (Fe/Co/Zn/Cd) transporter